MTESEIIESEIAQTERIGLGDLVISAVLAVVVYVLSTFWEFGSLLPSLWPDAVVAAGVRPAEHIVPGYWTILSSFVFSTFGVGGGENVLKILGHLFLAGIAVCVYAVLREWLAFAMRMRPQLSRRRTFVMRLASILGAVAFVIADPVWMAGQYLSETSILLSLTLAAIEFYFVFLRKGEIKYAYLCFLLLGLLAAESPFGFLLPALLIALTFFVMKVMPALESPLFRPTVMEVGKWHMTFLFLLALLTGIAVNCWSFVAHDGVAAMNETIGSLPLTYLIAYWGRIANAGDIGAWILWLGVSILPFVVTTIRFPPSADEEQFLTYGSGLTFFVCGLAAISQSSFLPALWFWTYFPMGSQFLLTVGIFCCAMTLSSAITVLGVDSLCRNHARLARQVFGEDEFSVPDFNPNRSISRSTDLIRRLGMVIVPIIIVSVMIPGRVNCTAREMLRIIQAAIEEIVVEADDAKYLFTDGNLDTAIELESMKRGGELKCLSLMGGGDTMATYRRTRGMTDEEDLFSFRMDTGMGLRSWIRDKPSRLATSAALMGFDLWKRDGRPLPPMSGMLSRPTGFKDESMRVAGVEKAHTFCDRVMAVVNRVGGLNECTDIALRTAFLNLQWRLARMCIYRGEIEDVKGNAEAAIDEAQRARLLNDKNTLFQDLVTALEHRNASMMQRLTPREGLQLALVRADFTLGKVYADTILAADPDNADANFAMGMYYLGQHQFSRAEIYLTRCLIRNPNEPAVYNNLAMIQIELKKFKAARVNIEKALKIIPGSSAVLDTKKSLEAAEAKAQGKVSTK